MTERFATTPFGGRSLSHAMFAAQEKVAKARQKLLAADSEGNPTPAADKWRLLRSLTEARAVYGLSDRTIAVLEALLSFHQSAELNGREPLIVFPSNAELSMRTRGMAPATLRRHLAALVDAQMIIRRDSPNGKRYARRGNDGEIKSAFGFDLAPLALRADEIEGHAAAARALARSLQALRTEITIHLRDIAKTIGAAASEGRAGHWEEFAARLTGLSGRVARNAAKDELSNRRQELSRLRADVEIAFLNALPNEEMSANESDSERHIQNSDSDFYFEDSSEKELNRNRQRLAGAKSDEAWQDDAVQPGEIERTVPAPLETVMATCPQFALYARRGIGDWRDFVQTAGLVRTMLGVSPDAWDEARQAMGELTAAVTIATILERSTEIRSPGGYLRALTERAENGRYSVGRVLNTLSSASRAQVGQKGQAADAEMRVQSGRRAAWPGSRRASL
ncbi:replication initiation protein RepC [Mesorhizobium soli]|uniref:plasmid replication protein RepC n=1 Tax=Pseudaminobacter soli (ex Li et al. 2025) TaxID=1295366 RepID=UPI002472F8F2|nr:plasmid replication protein RepC [Mesorhizobium soli]MDH6234006.1 replication initiation protein RepC [Mesorhizobium soli]